VTEVAGPIARKGGRRVMMVYLTAIRDGFALLFSGSSDVWSVIGLSMAVSGTAVVIATLIGVPIGYWLGMSRFGGRWALILLVNTAMGFPPVVVGLFVYMALSRTGPLGGLALLFTPQSMVVAQVILAAPLVAGVTTAAIASVPRDLRLQVRGLGASRWQEYFAVIKESRRGVMAAVIAGFGGIISEVGAVSIVGGNIQGSTRVMTTAIVFFVSRGDFGTAMAWAMVLIGITLVVNAALTTLQHAGVTLER
jgi:tungstate transport system permease protein